MANMSEECKQLASPGAVSVTFSILIFLGILLSYLPQHYRIISRKTSFGISPYFILLGTTSGTSGFANILVLPKSARDIACCSDISGFACFAGLLGILQVGVQTLCFAICLILFVVYFPRNPPTPVSASGDVGKSHSFRTALAVGAICLIHAIAVIILALTVVLAYPSSRQLWANILGVMATILSSIQYFPQIYTTWRLRGVGSLSIQMMCIQTPGAIVWAASLAERLGMEGWSTWGVYVVTSMLQGTLLVMGVYFEYVNPQKPELEAGANKATDPNGRSYGTVNGADNHAQDDAISEDTPLLQG
ncbi:PQ loop repeat protein [Arthroderma uncinatum]|uniref:PQ loop repeat protein n=1 Tax=Arthroderma uncinatum TaxID=74035 RepID=UPI00144AD71C|nr:PQ loop repeat protein [Arthroderma uncinatum]KAF3491545.1 PQ loop repeat protein [Arthroderma uncinatum]